MPTTDAFLPDMLQDPGTLARAFPNVVFRDPRRACSNLTAMATHRVPRDLMQGLCRQLGHHLAGVSDPDMALNNLERFFSASRSGLALAALFERDTTCIPILLTIFSSSQYLSDLLIRDPAAYDSLRLTAGQPVSREVLIDEITALLDNVPAEDQTEALRLLRRFKHREILRIAFGDIVAQQDVQTVTAQISYVADASCVAALQFAGRTLALRYGWPLDKESQPVTACIIAMGKLGGNELNYSSDLDLVMFYRADGRTSGSRSIDNREYFDRLARTFASLLNDPTTDGVAWRIDYRLRPHGSTGPLASGLASALAYYDLRGRTWERQALVKARPIAGDRGLGRQLLERLQPWVYGQRLSMTEINGIRALKRQIERRALIDGDAETNIKTGRGGIRDIEFVIQFLQLLHGSALPEVRGGNTLEAIARLFQAGCLSFQEQMLLDQGYRWLRRLEHRLQIMFDLQTHSLPADPAELRKVAMRTGLPGEHSGSDADTDEILERFLDGLKQTTHHHRVILDHLLHNAFAGDDDSGGEEADLVLDPDPDPDWVAAVLSRHGFLNPTQACRHLMDLATESSQFLSSHRCRHFLAAIAEGLLREIGQTPDPDSTLLRLSAVSDSLGGKAILWELFSSNPSTLKLYVRLCAACDYLCDLLVRNPGMVDGLMDSLVLQSLPSFDFLKQALDDLVRGAEDIDPILHSFRDAQHLRVGARDVTGRDDIGHTHRALADIAEVCLAEVVRQETGALHRRHGHPRLADGSECSLMILALGKHGGQEPNYHSDLDLVFVYPGDGATMTCGGRDPTSHQDFFSRLAANIAKRVSHNGPWGKLYEVDCRLRPTGKSGPLAVSTGEFTRYFIRGAGELWERLALCKARLVCAPDAAATSVAGKLVASLITAHPWDPAHASEIARMRQRMEQGASPQNIKRGVGGTVDIEFAVQMLQLKHAWQYPDVLQPNTIAAATALHRHGCLSDDDFEYLTRSWKMLRWVEARLRLMNTTARHDLPTDAAELARLTWLLEYSSAPELIREIDLLRDENRRRFLRLVDVHGRS